MSEYQESIGIRSQASEVFRFLSDAGNIPRYLPMVREARMEAGDRIWALAEPAKQQREVRGYFRADHDTRRVDWAIDGAHGYRGGLEVRESGPASSTLDVRIATDRQDERHVRQALHQVLEAIKRVVEERGGGRVAGGGAA